jgi:prolyl-tRNA synthetase
VPVRIELGPRDLAANQVVLVRRDTGEKTTVPLAELATTLPALLDEIQANLYETAKARLDALTVDVSDWETLAGRVATNAGWNRTWWCGSAACEERVKQETKATIRCIPLDQPGGTGSCIACGSESTQQVIMARAY